MKSNTKSSYKNKLNKNKDFSLSKNKKIKQQKSNFSFTQSQ